MKDSQSHIDSGVLELFVSGSLPENEMVDVALKIKEDETLLNEVVSIENGFMHLARAAAPYIPSFEKIKNTISREDVAVIPLSRKRTPIYIYLSWAASLLLLAGVGYLYIENTKLEDQIVQTERDLLLQKGKSQVAEEELKESQYLLNGLRGRNVISVPLGGQAIAPEAYASVFWDKENNKAYIDVKGLPKPPEGKVYQLWSLTLDPLTPTSLGVLDDYDAEGNQLFEVSNPNASEAFGITLEPAGGSASPTLEQLYTLGVVAS